MIRVVAICIVAYVSWPRAADARTFRVDQVPHGPQFSCDVCHLPEGGLNDFGFDAFLYLDDPRGDLDWSELYDLDSDGDGYTNGEELGDPQGTWRIGDPAPPGMFSHPGDRADGLCGNGVLEGAEDCEGGLDGVTCESLGLGPGDVACGNDCRFDTSACDSCGDGVRQMGEECDGDDLSGTTCMYLGLGSGMPTCNGCRLDTSTCRPNEVCGDGLRSGTELCDGENLGSQTCATLGYSGGMLACRSHCTYDTTGCVGDVADVAVVDAQPEKPAPDESRPDVEGTDDPDVATSDAGGCTVAPSEGGPLTLLFSFVSFAGMARGRRGGRGERPGSGHSLN